MKTLLSSACICVGLLAGYAGPAGAVGWGSVAIVGRPLVMSVHQVPNGAAATVRLRLPVRLRSPLLVSVSGKSVLGAPATSLMTH